MQVQVARWLENSVGRCVVEEAKVRPPGKYCDKVLRILDFSPLPELGCYHLVHNSHCGCGQFASLQDRVSRSVCHERLPKYA